MDDFSTTGWTLVERLRSSCDAERDALEAHLFARYWPPVYHFYRGLGEQETAAADLTQGFFLDVVMGRKLLERADRERGRLRSLIRTAARNYRLDALRAPAAAHARATVSISATMRADEEQFRAGGSGTSADDAFERRWATIALDAALARCEKRMRDAGLERHWALLADFVVHPAVNGTDTPTLTDLAERHGFESRIHAGSALKVGRKHFLLALREVVATEVDDPAEQEAEYVRLLEVLGVG